MGPEQAAPTGNKGPIIVTEVLLIPFRLSQASKQLSLSWDLVSLANTGEDQAIPVPQPKDPKVAVKDQQTSKGNAFYCLVGLF